MGAVALAIYCQMQALAIRMYLDEARKRGTESMKPEVETK